MLKYGSSQLLDVDQCCLGYCICYLCPSLGYQALVLIHMKRARGYYFLLGLLTYSSLIFLRPSVLLTW